MSNPKYQSLKVTDSSEEIGEGGTLLDTNMAESHTVSSIPSTHSSQHLMSPDSESVLTEEDQKSLRRRSQPEQTFNSVTTSQWFTVAVLCFINLINYMDRFTIAGVLTDIQDSFQINDDDGGLLQTVFILSYMIFAPIFGYLGDRFSRKAIMAFGITLWGATTLLGSFMNSFGWFLAFRAFVGIGEASYSTIAPTILSDLFIHDLRSKMLAVFYFAIPVGSGLGYIIGSETAKALGSWHWALRVTPALALIAVVLLFFIQEPERGQSDGSAHMQTTSYVEDVKDVCRNKSFMLSTAGFTCVAFVAGALAWFGPKFMHLGLQMQPGNEHIQLSEVSFIFGAITMTAGIMGVPLGAYLSTKLSKRYPRCDPVICAVGLLLSAPLLSASMIVVTVNAPLAYILVFLGEIALNLNWAIVADMLLYVVVPTRRSTAEAFQILISHAFGDAGSPYLVGVISEAIKAVLRKVNANARFGLDEPQILSQLAENVTTVVPMTTTLRTDTVEVQFKALQYSLFSTSFVEVLGGIFFLLTAAYILKDRANVDRAVAGTKFDW
ncbi:hypothetical protein PVAND_002711 [Polypedilum vanderplanki]|uniref:Major facilitator superfamily (MFS) profile domain-containing protein n=1 Tax=Polypedilum vanderplanki TaxID=319348 RepID=A0A9J6BSY9_POLVA|nr:hypothetical protein PVAND_002711 [Polypedilum vanderplanki]